MDAAIIRAGVVVGLAVAMPVGPIGLMVVALGRRDGRSGAAGACGVAAADLTWALVAVTGGAAVSALPGMAVMQTFARVVLVAVGVWLLVRGFRRLRMPGARPGPAPPARAPLRWFAVMYGLTVPNPLTVAVFGAATLRVGVGAAASDRLLFVASVGAASLAWQLALALLGRRVLTRTGPAVEGLLTATAGAVLVGWSVSA